MLQGGEVSTSKETEGGRGLAETWQNLDRRAKGVIIGVVTTVALLSFMTGRGGGVEDQTAAEQPQEQEYEAAATEPEPLAGEQTVAETEPTPDVTNEISLVYEKHMLYEPSPEELALFTDRLDEVEEKLEESLNSGEPLFIFRGNALHSFNEVDESGNTTGPPDSLKFHDAVIVPLSDPNGQYVEILHHVGYSEQYDTIVHSPFEARKDMSGATDYYNIDWPGGRMSTNLFKQVSPTGEPTPADEHSGKFTYGRVLSVNPLIMEDYTASENRGDDSPLTPSAWFVNISGNSYGRGEGVTFADNGEWMMSDINAVTETQ
jgi:hypothetical protein